MISTHSSVVALVATMAVGAPASIASDSLLWDFSIGNPGVGYAVRSLAIYNGDIIAGCSGAGQTPSESLALVQRWDGASWQPLGPPFTGSSATEVGRILVHEGELYILGNFEVPGHPGAPDAARWNGAGWEPLGEGPGGRVYSATVHEGEIVVSGYFGDSFGYTNTRVKRWSGEKWIALGNQFDDTPVTPVLTYQGELLACNIDFFDSAWVGRVSMWNGTTWVESGIGTGMSMRPGSIRQIDGDLYATHAHSGTDSDDTGTIVTVRDGEKWKPFAVATPLYLGFPIGRRAACSSVRKYGDYMLLTGTFGSVNGVPGRGVFAVSGDETHSLVDTHDFGYGPGPMLPIGNTVIVGGAFTMINGQSAGGVVALTGASAACPGDANADNRVDTQDLFQLLNDYTRHGAFLPSDVNSDGSVDFLDLNAVLTRFGQTCQ